jgi:hypothetical protein
MNGIHRVIDPDMAAPGRIRVSLLALWERRDLRRQQQDFAPEQRDTLAPGRETPPGFSLDGRQRRGALQFFLACRIQPVRGATCGFCATCDFWTLKRDSCTKRYPSGVCPSPARETAPGFSLRGHGTPKGPLIFCGLNVGAPNASVFWPPPPRTSRPQNWQRNEENRKARRPDDRFFCVSWRR